MFVLLLFDCTHIWLQKASIYEIKYLPRTQRWLRISISEVVSFSGCLCGFVEAVNVCVIFVSLSRQIYKLAFPEMSIYNGFSFFFFCHMFVIPSLQDELCYTESCVCLLKHHVETPKALWAAGFDLSREWAETLLQVGKYFIYPPGERSKE